MQLRHAARTDVGKTRDHNEDSYGIEVGGERAHCGALFVVCDGVGGYAGGEVASALAVKTIASQFYESDDPDPSIALESAFHAANQVVFRQGGGKMGTTGVAALFKDDALLVANVGDCRAYLVRDGRPHQISRDHSFVAEQVAAGMLTEEQAQESSYRNIITRAIGQRPNIEVDLFHQPLLNDDIVVLCSDGLHGQVSGDEIALAVTRVPLDDACQRLIKLANDRGGPDNITVVAVKVAKITVQTDSAYDQQERQAGATAKTARLAPTDQPAPRAVAAGARRQASAVNSSHVERRLGADRRSADRRSASPVTPPAPQRSGSALRSFLLWLSGLLLLAALIFGGYFFVLMQDAASVVPPASTRPTLTPIGDTTPTSLVPTLVPPASPRVP